MNVAMVTILKNVTNLITAVGEVYLFNKRHNNKVWGSLFLMVSSFLEKYARHVQVIAQMLGPASRNMIMLVK